MNEKEKKELALSKLILIGLAIIGVLIVVFLAWLRPNHSVNESGVHSFKECVEAGNPVQESYPEVCVSEGGKHFSNPDQNIQHLVIKEWDVAANLTGTKDTYYRYDGTAGTIFVSNPKLDTALKKIKGCMSGLRGITYERHMLGEPNESGGTWDTAAFKQANAAQVGEYYYLETPIIEVMCMPAETDDYKTIKTEQDRIRAGFRSLLES